MDIQSLQSNFILPSFLFSIPHIISDFSFTFTPTPTKRPSSLVNSSTQQGLKPRPKLLITPQTLIIQTPQRRNPVSGLCSEIEKRAFYRRYEDALELFEILECEGGYHHVGSGTYDALVNACIGLKSITGVKRVYGYMMRSGVEGDLYLRNRMLLMHVKCGMLIDARRLFAEMTERNVVSWNTIIGGLVDSGEFNEALDLFFIMWREFDHIGSRTFAMMIRAIAGLGLVSIGCQLHCCLLKMGMNGDVFVSCGLIDMYSKCGNIEDAQFVFDGMSEKTLVGWNSIIAGYALHGYSEKALSLYYEMRDLNVKMDHFTYSLIFRICTRLASLEHAKQAHAGLVRHGFGSDTVANTALVDFYSKWGRIEDARRTFDKMPHKNVISWNALIAGYGKHGRGVEAVEVFEQMLHEGRMAPNHVTFLAVLSACAYSGLSDTGWEIFESMRRDHKIKPRPMHHACMIELLGREGLLDEALVLIRDAPFRPSENMWAALLTACRVHNNLELGKFAAEKLYRMEPEKLSNYIVLVNIYNSSGRFKDASDVIQTLERLGLKMCHAHSWIEIKKQTHFFLSGDKSHAQTQKIYQKLDELVQEISKHGYVPACKSVLPDVDNQEEHISSYHSEKLAVAFGLISTSESTSLQLLQSHRICRDCHKMIKLVSMVARRDIVVRDSSRFHHFKNGACSCNDYCFFDLETSKIYCGPIVSILLPGTLNCNTYLKKFFELIDDIPGLSSELTLTRIIPASNIACNSHLFLILLLTSWVDCYTFVIHNKNWKGCMRLAFIGNKFSKLTLLRCGSHLELASRKGNLTSFWEFISYATYRFMEIEKRATPRAQLFAWKCLRNMIPCRANIGERLGLADISCPLCSAPVETLYHIFLECSFTRVVWFVTTYGGLLHGLFHLSLLVWIEMWLSPPPTWPIDRATWTWVVFSMYWMIWKARCAWVFQNTRPDPSKISRTINKWLYNEPVFRNDQLAFKAYWVPPALGWDKINVDASFCKDKLFNHIGLVIRDTYNTFSAARASSRRFASSEEGEALAVLDGVLWARERGLQRVIIETDAEAIYSFCKNGEAAISWTTKAILQDCLAMFGHFIDISASQVYQSTKIEVLSKMIPFFDFPVIEKISVDAVKSNFIAMKADHLKGVILFGCLEREEESKKLKLQNISEEADLKCLASEYSKREEQRIRREMESEGLALGG
ncbi:hypothetical protein GIB67_036393 [Kingdonia uniflora]|uniref:Pentatricopeptide repeat-containing protein n=1 Tax=Kingdonia uniflora TaxID=39325 RepID=A0A7J7L406_9MAGN|nr:hypothetical protein GIB67_036393 [Kingdonia uniflora]